MLFISPNHSAFGCRVNKAQALSFLLLLLCINFGSSSSFPIRSSTSSLLATMSKITESSPLISNGSKASAKEDDIHSILANMRNLMEQTHASRVNFSYAWRKDQLARLEKMVTENWEEIMDALQKDLSKGRVEAACFEMGELTMELDYFKSNLKSLMQPQDKASPVLAAPAFSKITPLPRNGPAVLVIGPSNYPISISLTAVAGSFAAGNPTVLKPSELCPASAAFLAKYVPMYFDSNAFQVVEGGVLETTALLELEWGLIHFTGSERVGKIVASAAAKTLTPIVLELGGKCPCIIDETCPSDLEQVANRIVWAKTVNCGQNCISPDYLLIHKSKSDALVPELTKALKKQFGVDPKQSGLGKLVAPGHVKRAIELLEEVEELAKTDKKIQILVGGSKECDVKTGYVAPTFILNPPLDCRVMQEEIFSPIMGIVVVESREEAVRIVNSRPGIPLGLYVFTTRDKVFEELTERCRSGTAVRNDMMVQFLGPFTPFGGLGSSGMGSYRGAESFKVFSHILTTVYRPCVPGADMNLMRCHPFVSWKQLMILKLAPKLPKSTPVLKTFRRTLFATILAVAAARVVPGANALIVSARVMVADLLRLAATALSP